MELLLSPVNLFVPLPLLNPRFPLELETYTPQGLAAHEAAAHKHCEFFNSCC
jgi:hypothetical protein